jgi:hypothetical protein
MALGGSSAGTLATEAVARDDAGPGTILAGPWLMWMSTADQGRDRAMTARTAPSVSRLAAVQAAAHSMDRLAVAPSRCGILPSSLQAASHHTAGGHAQELLNEVRMQPTFVPPFRPWRRQAPNAPARAPPPWAST